MRRPTTQRLINFGRPAIVFLLFLLTWQISTSLFSVPPYILPAPSDILNAAQRVSSTFFHDFWITCVESIVGFVIGSVGAFVLALSFARYSVLEKSLMPYVIATKTIPIVAVAPLLVIWFGAGLAPKVMMSGLICFFPVLISTVKGLKEVDPDQVDLFRSLAASDSQIFRYLRLPNCLVYLFPSLRIAIVFAVTGAVVAEFASANAGLGFKIMMASFHVDTPAMFVYIIACSVLSLALYAVVAVVERMVVPWSFSERSRGS